MELDPRLREDRPSDRAIDSPYAYPPASAGNSGPAPYALNSNHQEPSSPQSRSNALPSLSQPLPYYGVQQEHGQQTPLPPTGPSLVDISGLAAVQAHGDSDTPKRPRACEACRGLKVRCDFEGDAEVCKRCAKANRECVVTAPNRRRPKKTDTRVADLEKRIDDLTATLEQQRRQSSMGKRLASDEGFGDGVYPNGHAADFYAEPVRKKRKSSYQPEDDMSPHLANGALSTLSAAGHNTGSYSPLPPLPPDHLVLNEYADVIDRGMLSNSVAAQVYEHYTNNMAKHLPAVVFPSTMTAGGLRKSRPVLFLAILSVASGQDYPELQRSLTREANKALADRVLCKGEKSLELIQAMQVMSIWHASEDQNDTMAFQLIQMASTMAIAMELGGPPLRGKLGLSFISGSSKIPKDFNSPEKRRAWLSCYILSGSTSLTLKQLNLVRWSPFLENALQVLETSPEATATDKTLCKWARLQHLMDQASEPAHLAACTSSNSEQVQLRERLQKTLNEAKDFASSIATDTSHSLQLAAHEINIYCNLIAAKVEEMIDGTNEDLIKSEPGATLTASHAEALKAGAESIHQLLEQFLRYLETSPQKDLNSLPSFHFARIAYTIVALIYMFFAASASESKVSAAIDPKDFKIAEYLPRLLELLRSTATDETRRPAQKFQLIVKMLKAWYERTKDGRKSPIRNEISEMLDLKVQPVDEERNTPRLGYRKLSIHGTKTTEDDGFSSPTSKKTAQSTPAPVQNANLPPGNTPLDLLSEVATKAPSAQASQDPNSEWYNNATSYQPYQQPYAAEVAQGSEGQVLNANNAYNGLMIDPALEQAMGMAFGSEGNIFPTFVDEYFGGMQSGLVQPYGNWFPASGGQ